MGVDRSERGFGVSLQEEVAAINWWHKIDLGSGIITPGINEAALQLPKLHLPADMTGLRVLDIGAWDGFYSFECARRGAQVLATDSFVWSGQNTGAGRVSKAGFECARRALGFTKEQVDDLTIDVLVLDPNRIGTFDIVLFLGVLYHMRHPMLALDQVRSVVKTDGLLVLESHVNLTAFNKPALAFYENDELADDATNWFGPNPPAVLAMLRAAGFTKPRQVNLHNDRIVAHANG